MSSININYFHHLPIQNFSPIINTIPMAILILGLAEFFLFHVSFDWRSKIRSFFLVSKISNISQFDLSENPKALGGNKNKDLGICRVHSSTEEKISDERLYREDIEIVLQRMGIVWHCEGESIKERLDYDDLVNIFEEKKPSLDEVKEAFYVFDENKDGFIDSIELQRILLSIGLKEGLELENCRMMIRIYDENRDGRIDFDEFVKFMGRIDF